MGKINPHLAAVLDTAAEIQEDDPDEPKDAAGAFRYALLKRLEENLGLPLLVKYGDADAVRDEYGVSNDPVWGATPDGDYTLFRIEWEADPRRQQRMLLERTMLAAGAWGVGKAEPSYHQNDTHQHYVWPNDHPVLDLMPDPP